MLFWEITCNMIINDNFFDISQFIEEVNLVKGH